METNATTRRSDLIIYIVILTVIFLAAFYGMRLTYERQIKELEQQNNSAVEFYKLNSKLDSLSGALMRDNEEIYKKIEESKSAINQINKKYNEARNNIRNLGFDERDSIIRANLFDQQ